MGTSLELIVRAERAEEARRAEGRVLAAIDRLSRVFSGYDPSSEFSRWQAARSGSGPVKVSPELFEVLARCDHWAARTAGAFDPRVEALSRLWSSRAAEGRTPDARETADVKAVMGRPAWRLDAEGRTAERLSDGPLTLNAIAKGYVVGVAAEAGMAGGKGVTGLLLNVGGDLVVRGDLAGTIGIAPAVGDSESGGPSLTVEVRDKAVATSGNARRGYRIDGRWYSHIFDPRSGEPAAGVVSATVIADRPLDADALATALNVLPPADGVRLVESVPGADCLVVAKDGRVSRSRGLAPVREGRAAARRGGRRPPRGEGVGAAVVGRPVPAQDRFRDQPPGRPGGPLPPAVRGRLGRGQGRVPGA